MDFFDFFETQITALSSAITGAHASVPAKNQTAAQAEGEMLCGERQEALAAGANMADFDFREFTGSNCG